MNDYNNRKCCYQNNMSNINNMNNAESDCKENVITSECSNLCTMPVNNCNCGFDMDESSMFPDNPMLAQSYVPIQQMKKVFSSDIGLKMGTIFPELVSPYIPCQSIREIEYIRARNEIGEGCNR